MASTHVKLQTFHNFLTSRLPSGQTLAHRSSSKFNRLPEQQLQVLLTDVYDELIRRTQSAHIPHLISKNELDDRRNRARAKLASLSDQRFFELVNDVYFELDARRSRYESGANGRSGPPKGGNSRPPPINTSESSSHQAPASARHPPGHLDPGEPSTRPPMRAMASQPDLRIRPSRPFNPNFQPAGGHPSSPPQQGPPSMFSNSSNTGYPSITPSFSNFMNASPSAESPHPINGHASVQSNSQLTEQMDRMKEDYERQIDQLQEKVKSLERGVANANQTEAKKLDLLSENTQLMGNLEEIRSRNRELERQVSQLNQEAEKLRAELMDYQKDHQFNAERDRGEKDNLRRQIGKLTSELGELRSQNDHYSKRTKKLMDEKIDLENQIHVLKQRQPQANDSAPLTPAYSASLPRNDSKMRLNIHEPKSDVKHDGAIERAKVTAFQSTVDGLLRVGKSNKSSEVLVAMKGVVLACRSITDDLEAYERSVNLSADEQERVRDLQAQLSQALNALTTAAKKHAGGMGLSPISLLESAADRLSTAIIDLAKTVKLRPRSPLGSPAFSAASSTYRASNDLIGSLTSPVSLRSPTAPAATIYTNSNGPAKNDRGNESLYNDRSRSGSHNSRSSPGYTAQGSLSTRLSGSTTNGGGLDANDSWNTNKSSALKPNGHATGETSGSGLSVEELRDFLEVKTDQVVQSIQDMLQTSRTEDVNPVALCLNLRQIISTVASIIVTCRSSFDHFSTVARFPHGHSRPLSYLLPPAFDSQKASQYLTGLTEGDDLLQTLVVEIYKAAQMAAINNQFANDHNPNFQPSSILLNESSPRPGKLHEFHIDNRDLETEVVGELVNDKVFKQRLTSAVFDIARYTKFLVSLME
ncbi:component of the polarisome [Dispira parvispora]|uniref:Component of the polarisome n=1 Tax=Dispira parvispora TaxID=1520584 RepID=A0A9W8E791_9FUNG|nr:component of the polarisome [Dispira parvispora]